MILYRRCSYKEVINLLLGLELGKEFEANEKLNTHKYEPNTKYVHFFYDINSIIYLPNSSGEMICTYEFPDELVSEKGIGYYWEQMDFSYLVNIEEIAIKASDVKFKNLVKLETITDYFDYEDVIYEGLDKFKKEVDIKKLVKK